MMRRVSYLGLATAFSLSSVSASVPASYAWVSLEDLVRQMQTEALEIH